MDARPPQILRVIWVPSNSTHSCEPVKGWTSLFKVAFQLPIKGSKSRWPSRRAALPEDGAPACAGGDWARASPAPASRAAAARENLESLTVLMFVFPPPPGCRRGGPLRTYGGYGA